MPSTNTRRLASSIALALLVVLAGCSGLPGSGTPTDGGTTPTPTPTATTDTPTPTPTATPSPSPETVAPGLTESGVVDAWALAREHKTTLRSVSRTVQVERTVTAADGTTLARVETTVDRSGPLVPGTYRRTVSGSAPGSVGEPTTDLAVWTNGTATVTKTGSGDAATYTNSSGRASVFGSDGTRWQTLFLLFTGTNVTVTDERTRNGVSAYRVESTGQPSGDSRFASYANVSLTAVVSEDGIVRRYELSYDRSIDGRQVTVTESVRFTDLTSTEVTKPTWYGTGNATV
jgi:hypothetical protein